MTGCGAIMMRHEKERLPSEVHDPQRLEVSLYLIALARLPIASVCLTTSLSISFLASRLR